MISYGLFGSGGADAIHRVPTLIISGEIVLVCNRINLSLYHRIKFAISFNNLYLCNEKNTYNHTPYFVMNISA